jgi:UPF0755 protein
VKRLLLPLAILGLIAIAGAGGAYLWFQQSLERVGPLTSAARVIVARGSGLSRVAQQLEKAGVVQQARLFQAMVMLEGKDKALQAGEYRFPPGETMQHVLDRLVRGDTVTHQLVFPEGMTTFEILAKLTETPDLTGDAPDGLAEGSLMPAAYDFSYGENRAAIVTRMQKAMADAVAEAWAAKAKGVPVKTPEEMVILASIVEKETGLDGERAKVAGVFVNRLKKGMKLQSDPTTIYAITRGKGSLGRGLRRSELANKDPYNTYYTPRLPPGPIANPGREALMAVAQPEATKALYFVADGTGGHAFAETLAQHNRNVARWRQIEKQKKAGK